MTIASNEPLRCSHSTDFRRAWQRILRVRIKIIVAVYKIILAMRIQFILSVRIQLILPVRITLILRVRKLACTSWTSAASSATANRT